MIKNAVIPISGFTQSIGKPTGFDCLWEDLRPIVNPETTLFQPVRWCDNMKHIAQFLARHLDQQDHTILVAAYSWGGGWGFTQLAKEFNKCGLKIKAAILCDPVYRSPHLTMRWRSLFNKIPILTPKIKIPASVHEVFWYYQTQSKPQAHKLVKANKKQATVIHHGQHLTGLDHMYMDDSKVFHHHVTDLFGKLLSK